MLAFVLALLLVVGGPKAPKVCEVELRVSPQMVLFDQGKGAGWITVRLEVKNADERCFCPSVELTVYPEKGSISHHLWKEGHEADCDPWHATGEIRRGEYIPSSPREFRWGPRSVPLPPGVFIVRVRFTQGAWKQERGKRVEVFGG